jgi:antitoxin (DNA-binding transcriptional repressor) of toxin-antitoxin stability system
MKTATVRDVQHHFNRIVHWTESGEDVQITRRNKPIARLVAITEAPEKTAPVDFYQRAVNLWKNNNGSLSDLIVEEREERI